MSGTRLFVQLFTDFLLLDHKASLKTIRVERDQFAALQKVTQDLKAAKEAEDARIERQCAENAPEGRTELFLAKCPKCAQRTNHQLKGNRFATETPNVTVQLTQCNVCKHLHDIEWSSK